MTSVRTISFSSTGRRSTVAIVVLGLVSFALVAAWAYDMVAYALQPDRSLIAVDFILYRDAASRWLDGGSYFLPHQLAGPYDVTPGDVLYPPYAIPLFVAFTVLPAVLWWAVPLVGTAVVVWWHRPGPHGWPILAVCLWFPATSVKILSGNPVMWAVLAVALATVWRWPGVFALLKPSLLPFALMGAWRRSWWAALAGLALVGLAFAPLWPEFATVLANARQDGGLLYSVQEVPMMALPIVAWLAGRWRPGARTSA